MFDGSNTLIRRYLHGQMIDQVLADENVVPKQAIWALSDHQGSVRDWVNNTGVVQNHIRYDSFGKIVSQTAPALNPRFAYTGREWDGEVGLYFYRARYYDPGVGRFVGEDPIGFQSRDYNLRRYVSNNPINRIDPSGNGDTRWPFNGAVTNQFSQPVYVLVSNKCTISYEVLYPGASTPNWPGRSKDADGVWIERPDGWKFYPIARSSLAIKPPTFLILPGGGVIDADLGARQTPPAPWDGRSDKNSPTSRGSGPLGNCPPDKRKSYPDASIWRPVLECDKGEQNFWGIRQ